MEFVRLEFAQIQSTLAQEKELASNFIWGNVIRDAPMRRRFAIRALLGLFTQWSGNGITSFYMSRVLNMAGVTNPETVQQVILSYTVEVLSTLFRYRYFLALPQEEWLPNLSWGA